MRAWSFQAARGALAALLILAFAILAAPSSGLAGTPDAPSAAAVVADGHDATADHLPHDEAKNRSCHPDPTCSPAAILLTRPIFGARGFQAAGQSLAGMTLSGTHTRVEPPPPRPGAGPRPNIMKYRQT